jgi:hypothetical protein
MLVFELQYARTSRTAKWLPHTLHEAAFSIDDAKWSLDQRRIGTSGTSWGIEELPGCAFLGTNGLVVVTEKNPAPLIAASLPRAPRRLRDVPGLLMGRPCYFGTRIHTPGDEMPAELYSWASSSNGSRYRLSWGRFLSGRSWDGVKQFMALYKGVA